MILQQLAEARRQGRPMGIYSVCSAHPWVLEAACDQAVQDGSYLLIEATSNQVNHLGGYTGMTPRLFRDLVFSIAAERGLKQDKLILGGDHLGPNPWQKLSSEEALKEAALMVRAYVEAGFTKIHLDASMACGGDSVPLSVETVARRAAALCAAAESEAGTSQPVYVIGTEVPTPGGATETLAELEVTSREAAAETVAVHKRVFEETGLAHVWPRVIALVVQPGVEFNHTSVVDFDPNRASHLRKFLDEAETLVFEAHSTDYQRPEAYRALVQGGFAILKVGPALTFAMREALDALSLIEAEVVPAGQRAHLPAALEQAMVRNPKNWEHHYAGDEHTRKLLRRYSYSDRVRYYWNIPEVQESVDKLLRNLDQRELPETMLSAFLPDQYVAVRAGLLKPDAHSLILDRIRQALRPYARACFG